MQGTQRIAVAGATGRVGRHVVDVLTAAGHDVVPISRSNGVDLVSGDGLAEALAGVDAVVDVATGPSPEQGPATEFFLAATRNLHEIGERTGVKRLVVVSIVGCDRFSGGYSAAKVAHERAALAGPIPARILRATQFHEFVAQLIDWGRQGDVSYVQPARMQLVAARTVAEALADLAVGSAWDAAETISEIGGPREESFPEVARLFVAKRGDPVRIEVGGNPADPDAHLFEEGALLPSPGASLAGPTFAEWLERAG